MITTLQVLGFLIAGAFLVRAILAARVNSRNRNTIDGPMYKQEGR